MSQVLKSLATRLRCQWSRVLFPSRTPPISRVDARFKAGVGLLLALAALLLFPNLNYPLLEPDEGRYAEIGREMLASGDWIVPRLYYRPYFDKPPLLYWLVAGSFKLFGTQEWSARIVPASAAFLTLLATLGFGARIVGARAALLAGLMLALSAGFVDFGRFLILDGILSLSVALALFASFEAIRGDRLNHRWWIVSAVFCALGVLAKGPVAIVLQIPPLLAHLWLTRSRARPAFRDWAGFVGVVVCLAGPWFAAIIAREPDFAHHFFWNHHIARFAGGAYHPHPVWFYVPVLLLGCMPWSPLLFPCGRFLFSRSREMRPFRTRSLGFLLLWAGWCIVFFSLSRGKLPPYILPSLPAIALLLGCYLDYALFRSPAGSLSQRTSSVVLRSVVAVICGCAIAVSGSAYLLGLANRSALMVESGLWAIGILGAIVYGRRLPPRVAWALCCVAATALNLETAHQLIPAWAAKNSPVARSQEILAELADEKTALACYGREWGSVAFFLRRDAILNFSTRPASELTAFLQEHHRTLLIIKASAELDWFRKSLPRGMAVAEVRKEHDFTVALLLSATPDDGADQTADSLPTAFRR